MGEFATMALAEAEVLRLRGELERSNQSATRSAVRVAELLRACMLDTDVDPIASGGDTGGRGWVKVSSKYYKRIQETARRVSDALGTHEAFGASKPAAASLTVLRARVCDALCVGLTTPDEALLEVIYERLSAPPQLSQEEADEIWNAQPCYDPSGPGLSRVEFRALVNRVLDKRYYAHPPADESACPLVDQVARVVAEYPTAWEWPSNVNAELLAKYRRIARKVIAAVQCAPRQAQAGAVGAKHPHYHKDVRHLDTVDPYRIARLFGLNDNNLFHAFKKVLCAGQRGAKNLAQDVQEAIDSLLRWQEMREEDELAEVANG